MADYFFTFLTGWLLVAPAGLIAFMLVVDHLRSRRV